MWDQFLTIWRYPLVTLSGGGSIAVSQIVLVLVLIIAGVFGSRVVERIVARQLATTRIQKDAAYALQRLLFYSIVIAVSLTALSLLRVPLTALAFISGAVAIGVGFGAQNIINNFISGWILMSEQPVRIGDFIEVEGFLGTIERIGNRSTRIRRTDGVHMLVPNSLMLERTVVNWTLVDREIRTSIGLGVSYASSAPEVERLILEAVTAHPHINKEPAPIVVLDDFGDNALIFEVFFWCEVSGERELRQIRSDVRFRILALFAENGIVISYPQRDVHLDSDRPLRVEVVGEATKRAAGTD